MTSTIESAETQPTATPRRRTPLVLGGVLVLIAAVIGIVLLGRSHELAKAPWSDAASTGLITLCDQTGQPVKSGSLTAKPLIWRAVGATAASDAYAAQGSSATLYAYQPRQGVAPAQWSGQMLTAPSQYSNAAHPIAAATAKDIDLKDFLTAYPAGWKGTVQLQVCSTWDHLVLVCRRASTTPPISLSPEVTGACCAAVRPAVAPAPPPRLNPSR